MRMVMRMVIMVPMIMMNRGGNIVDCVYTHKRGEAWGIFKVVLMMVLVGPLMMMMMMMTRMTTLAMMMTVMLMTDENMCIL